MTCKHTKELARVEDPADREEMAHPRRCKCGYRGCCSIDVYEHMLIVGVNILKGSKEHGFARIRRRYHK